jgi:hypothetical protein
LFDLGHLRLKSIAMKLCFKKCRIDSGHAVLLRCSVVILALMLLGFAVASAQDIDPTSDPNVQPYPGTPVSGYQLAWSDEFNGTAVDTNKWNFRTGVRFWSVQQPQNNAVSNGLYYILLKKETVGTNQYTSGGIISKKAVRYGYYESRMRTPPGRGWHTSFWMITGGTPVPNTSIELDIVENDSITPLKYGVNTHRWLPSPHVTYGNKTVNTPSLTASFHTFGCEFTPSTIKYFFDGALVQTVNATQFAHCDLNIWLTSVAAPLGGTTNVDDSLLPNVAEYEYARFFLPGPTSSVSIVAPSFGGVTLADTNVALRVAALATSSDPNYPPSVLWSRLSGPGTVTFGDPTSTNTVARFSAPGNYVLQCQATVLNSTNVAQVAVAIAAPLTLALREGVGGYAHVATFLRGDSINWNSGARDQFLIGRNNGQGLRPIFSFDLGAVETNALIQSVTLDLWTDPTLGIGTVGPLELRPLLSTPVEGIGDSSSSSSVGAGTGATWLTRTGATNTGDLWLNPGGDYASNVLASLPGYDATLTNQQRTFASTAAWVAAAQAAVVAEEPLNLLLVSPATESLASNTLSRFSSDDSPLLEQRPRLTLTYVGQRAPEIGPMLIPVATNVTPVTLNSSVSNANGVQWTKIAGPGAAIFDSSTQAVTTVSFGQPGNHILRLTAWNEFGEVSRDFPAQSVAVAQPGVARYEAGITFTGYNRSEPLTNFPALIRLGEHIFSFNYATFRTTNGGDLRFFGSDGVTELNYEVESWNPAGESSVWVRVPVFTNGSSIIARWGSGPTNRPAYTTNGVVWANAYVGVWHFNSTNVTDSTLPAQNASANTATATGGIVGGALNFSGTAQTTALDYHNSFDLASGFELQGWFKVNPTDKPASGDFRTLMGKETDLNNRNWWLAMQSNGSLLWKSSPGIDFATSADLADGLWHHVAAVHDGSVARLYVDGIAAASDATPGSADTQNAAVYFGAQYGTTRFMKGLLDEFRFSNVPRSSNWVWAVHQNIASNTTFSTYGNVTAIVAGAPAFNSVAMAGGAMNFQVSGNPYFSYTIQGSTNLTTWTDLFTTNPPALPFNWTDAGATNFPRRFYRVLLTP